MRVLIGSLYLCPLWLARVTFVLVSRDRSMLSRFCCLTMLLVFFWRFFVSWSYRYTCLQYFSTFASFVSYTLQVWTRSFRHACCYVQWFCWLLNSCDSTLQPIRGVFNWANQGLNQSHSLFDTRLRASRQLIFFVALSGYTFGRAFDQLHITSRLNWSITLADVVVSLVI